MLQCSVVKPRPVIPASRRDSGSSTGCSTSDSGKAAEHDSRALGSCYPHGSAQWNSKLLASVAPFSSPCNSAFQITKS